ncbi:hypothetical protein GWI33_006623 [Rhynchophorus ferrugineus]|uniref:Serine/threonine-protein phosphatase 4 regulatory subunit 3-like central domain-containing protein n=1 Tax=Rhynchophorus ferrugineus TaxID=354439 RepID=A0A834IHD0_RHYFE|nr:hypothetical protein GWI33_006623 [Rhynchophorus ferrugineus]
MICDSDPELGGAVQLMGVLRILLDPENMLASVNKSEKTDFLNFFYKHSVQILIAPLLENTVNDTPQKEDYRSVQLLGLILELLSFCVEHHTYHIKNCILNKDLLRRILVLMKSTHKFLVLCALRFMRKLIALKDEFYNRYIIKGNLFAPVVDAFTNNNGRYNLLDSAIIEMFEFIKLEDIKTLCSHVVENYGRLFDKFSYVQTFKALKLRYDQHQDKLKERMDGVPSILRNSRYRRDQRQMDEEEEMWFNEDDDFDDGPSVHKSPATPPPAAHDILAKKLDSNLESIGGGKIAEKTLDSSLGVKVAEIKTTPFGTSPSVEANGPSKQINNNTSSPKAAQSPPKAQETTKLQFSKGDWSITKEATRTKRKKAIPAAAAKAATRGHACRSVPVLFQIPERRFLHANQEGRTVSSQQQGIAFKN